MRSRLVFGAVDSHTEGMPTRVITSGVGELPGATMAERRLYVMNQRDDLRTLLMHEPRGHSAMSGAILQSSTRPDADVGVVFIEVSGCLPMCGHGTIGTATVLVETGMVPVKEPITVIRLDTPAGLVEASVEVEDGRAKSVTIRNVPAYLHLRGATVTVPGVGELTIDLAWGGNFYALLPAASVGLAVRPSLHDDLIRAGLEVMAAINDQLSFVHPEHQSINYCHHVVLTEPGDGTVSGRAAVAIHPGWLDRSPCGTGTSARMAQLHARGELSLGEDYVHASVLGTRFTGRLIGTTKVGGFDAVIPTVRGRAWLTGLATLSPGPRRPLPRRLPLGSRNVTRPGLRGVGGAPGRRVPGSGPRSLPASVEVLVVGAGIIGAAVASRLAAAGLDVCLLDRLGPAAGTSSAGEGNVLVSDKVPGPDLALALRGVALWHELAEEAGDAGDRVEFEAKGGLVVAHDEKELEALFNMAESQRQLGAQRRAGHRRLFARAGAGPNRGSERWCLLRAGLPGPAHGGRRLPRPPVRRARGLLCKGGRGRRRGARQAGEGPLGPYHHGHRCRRDVRCQRLRPVGG